MDMKQGLPSLPLQDLTQLQSDASGAKSTGLKGRQHDGRITYL
jgi:hypothetical protein